MKKLIKVLKYIFDLYTGDQILIYQMGKVGSSTLEKSISKLGIKVRHIHSFGNTSNYHFYKEGKLREIKKIILKSIYRLTLRMRRKNIKIITLMRDPISRNISTLFQELSLMLYEHEKKNNRRKQNLHTMLDEFLEEYVDSNIPLKWFDEELKYFMGIDLFNYPFDKEKGALYIKEGKIELLVLTAEKLNFNKDIIVKFINNESFEFINSNVSNEKWYSEINKNFKDNYKISFQKYEHFYSSKTVNYFYSKEDILNFKNKWL